MSGTINRVGRTTDRAYQRYQTEHRAFWDSVGSRSRPFDLSNYYHDRLTELYCHLVRSDTQVLELGCGTGDLLSAVRPRHGVGVDFSEVMIEIARNRHAGLNFVEADVHEFETEDLFDYIILSDLINDLWDVQATLERVRDICSPNTRVIINFYNKVWQLPLLLARLLGLAKPLKRQNWLTAADVQNLLRLSGFEVISTSREILFPLRVPLLTTFLNKVVVKFWPFTHLAMTHFVVARPVHRVGDQHRDEPPSVSIVVPARNEAGHIEDIVARTPAMGSRTELIFVEGNSTDDTYEVIARVVAEAHSPDLRLYRQPGKGKGDAVRHGFAHATGDILMILDADMTVAPEELPRFFAAIATGQGEFINGVRLVYPMEEEAMQFLNHLGNKFFGVVFSWILRQPVKDTLCGTKVLARSAYEEIVASRSYFGDFDPFGDFDLLFGAGRNHLRIVDMPIRYRERAYGATNIARWRHGVLLLKMAVFATRRLRFI